MYWFVRLCSPFCICICLSFASTVNLLFRLFTSFFTSLHLPFAIPSHSFDPRFILFLSLFSFLLHLTYRLILPPFPSPFSFSLFCIYLLTPLLFCHNLSAFPFQFLPQSCFPSSFITRFYSSLFTLTLRIPFSTLSIPCPASFRSSLFFVFVCCLNILLSPFPILTLSV